MTAENENLIPLHQRMVSLFDRVQDDVSEFMDICRTVFRLTQEEEESRISFVQLMLGISNYFEAVASDIRGSIPNRDKILANLAPDPDKPDPDDEDEWHDYVNGLLDGDD